MKSKLVLQNGKVFKGLNFGSNETKIGELYKRITATEAQLSKIV